MPWTAGESEDSNLLGCDGAGRRRGRAARPWRRGQRAAWPHDGSCKRWGWHQAGCASASRLREFVTAAGTRSRQVRGPGRWRRPGAEECPGWARQGRLKMTMMYDSDSCDCDHGELRCDVTVFDHLHLKLFPWIAEAVCRKDFQPEGVSVNSQIIDGIETSLEVAVNKPWCLVEASGNHTNVGHRDLQPEVVSANSPVNDGSKVNSEVALESPRGAETVQIPPVPV